MDYRTVNEVRRAKLDHGNKAGTLVYFDARRRPLVVVQEFAQVLDFLTGETEYVMLQAADGETVAVNPARVISIRATAMVTHIAEDPDAPTPEEEKALAEFGG